MFGIKMTEVAELRNGPIAAIFVTKAIVAQSILHEGFHIFTDVNVLNIADI